MIMELLSLSLDISATPISYLALPTKNSPPFMIIGHYTITRPVIDSTVLSIGLSLVIIAFMLSIIVLILVCYS